MHFWKSSSYECSVLAVVDAFFVTGYTQSKNIEEQSMGFSRASLSRICSLCSRSFFPRIPISTSFSFPSHRPMLLFKLRASLSPAQDSSLSTSSQLHNKSQNRWKPICLYYTQGKCTKMDDPLHIDKFNHDCSTDLQVNFDELNHQPSQNIDFFLVLDLEGKVEIIEYPVLLISAKTMEIVDIFHRFVRPSEMSEGQINDYIEGKYGKIGVDRVWHDTAIPFNEVIHQFEDWLTHHRLWEKDVGGRLNSAAFVTCGNWDLKTQIPHQCNVSKMKLPQYFTEWINIKDVYLNFYKRTASGMVLMLKQLQIPLLGSHHLGIDDTKNIAKVLQKMVVDGANMQITAWRDQDSPKDVNFLFKDRIK